jgi:hypothetical protein
MLKAFKPQKWTILDFEKKKKFTKCALFLLKFGEDFNIDD